MGSNTSAQARNSSGARAQSGLGSRNSSQPEADGLGVFVHSRTYSRGRSSRGRNPRRNSSRSDPRMRSPLGSGIDSKYLRPLRSREIISSLSDLKTGSSHTVPRVISDFPRVSTGPLTEQPLVHGTSSRHPHVHMTRPPPKAAPSEPTRPQKPRVFRDPKNWVDNDAIFAWTVTIIDAKDCTRSEQVSVYNSDCVSRLRQAWIQTSGCSADVCLFSLLGDGQQLQDDWELRNCVKNRGTIYAFCGTLSELLHRGLVGSDWKVDLGEPDTSGAGTAMSTGLPTTPFASDAPMSISSDKLPSSDMGASSAQPSSSTLSTPLDVNAALVDAAGVVDDDRPPPSLVFAGHA